MQIRFICINKFWLTDEGGQSIGPIRHSGGDDTSSRWHRRLEDLWPRSCNHSRWQGTLRLGVEFHGLPLQGKGGWIGKGNYRGLKLTEQVMKVLERIVDGLIRQLVSIDDSQFGFVPGRGTTDSTFVVRQLLEKYLAANKRLYMAFVDLEKAFLSSTSEGHLVGTEKMWCWGVDCTTGAVDVCKCAEPCPCWWGVQWRIWSEGFCSPRPWVRHDQNEYELTKISTSWPNNEDELTKWVRIDQIDENELTKMRTNWLKYELTGNHKIEPRTSQIFKRKIWLVQGSILMQFLDNILCRNGADQPGARARVSLGDC